MERLIPDLDLQTRGVLRSLHTNHYVVSGTNVAELREAVTLLGPRRQDRALGGSTVWAVRWTFEARAAGGRFHSARVTVAVDTVVRLPRWEPEPGADTATRNEWNRYVLALAEHEAGHVAIAQRAASDVAALLRDLAAGTPLALHRKGDEMARERIARGRADDAAYDEGTRHGGSQGARLGLALVPKVALDSSRCA